MRFSKRNFRMILAFLIVSSFLYCKKDGAEEKNPYEYNIDDLRKIPQELIKYREANPIKPDLTDLTGISIDGVDNIYITGDLSLLIMKSNGDLVSRIELEDTAKCVTTGPDGTIYLGMNRNINVYSADGNKKKSWEKLDERGRITSVAATGENIFVADAGNRIVLKYDMEGNITGEIGRKNPAGNIPGFVIPSPYFDLAIGYEGFLWVVKPGRHSFENYTMDGKLRSSWKRSSMSLEGFCGCCNPTHIAILRDGSFVTSEKGLERIKIHNQSGDLEAVVAGPDKFKEGTVGLDLAVDSDGRVFVLDPERKSIRIFEKKINE